MTATRTQRQYNMSGAGGIRTPPKNAAISEKFAVGGAISGALSQMTLTVDPNLDLLIEAWPWLPAPIKEGILAMVRAAKG
jgi:hypothetical protein